LGYRHMCRFHSSQVHTYLSKLGYTEYEYVMRLDDDSLITAPVGYDLFRYMRENGKKYAFTNMVEDDPVCVQNLWESSERFYNDTGQAQAQAHNESLFMRWPRGVVFYNNLEISHLSVWKDPLWLEYMQHVDELGGIYTLRWGDAPLHTIGVTMLLNKRQIHSFSD
ncbi:nucleotide-diphospho-sugar transferase, partial [Ochromonadaceae sp. CCMP2298]